MSKTKDYYFGDDPEVDEFDELVVQPSARDRLVDAVEQEKAQKEYDVEKALKDASRIQLENELKERNESGLFPKYQNTESNIPVEYQRQYNNDEL